MGARRDRTVEAVRQKRIKRIYDTARKVGEQGVSRVGKESFCLDFELCSIVLEMGPVTRKPWVELRLHQMPTYLSMTYLDAIFDFARPVYRGDASGVEELVMQDMRLDADTLLPCEFDEHQIRFRGSKDGRALLETDVTYFDRLLGYCETQCRLHYSKK